MTGDDGDVGIDATGEVLPSVEVVLVDEDLRLVSAKMSSREMFASGIDGAQESSKTSTNFEDVIVGCVYTVRVQLLFATRNGLVSSKSELVDRWFGRPSNRTVRDCGRVEVQVSRRKKQFQNII